MRISKRKTKIVATIGPASGTREVVRELILSGMNVARLNFSHGSHEEHSRTLEILREESQRLGAYIAVFQDLCGPKVRIGDIEGKETNLIEGSTVLLKRFSGELGNSTTLYVEAFDPAEVMRPGEKALLADGRIELVAQQALSDGVKCVVKSGGMLRSRSGIAVPDSKLNLPCLTDKDLVDLEWGVKNDIDFVALSFVSSAKDVLQLKEKIKALGGAIPVIAKIERATSLDHIAQIVEVSDAVMVARGDLGLELPLERVPGAQKLIIDTANHRGTPVITATQMLQSMVLEARPTRAEASDVCTAVRDGTDAVMLSEETAVGKHPVHVVQVLDRILEEAEKEFLSDATRLRLRSSDQETVADSICYAACGAATKVGASAIIACTQSGYTARLMAKYRPQQPLFGATSERKALTRMATYWGVHPLAIRQSESTFTEDEILRAMNEVREQYGLKPGYRVVITAGLQAKQSGSTTLMEIREIPRNA